LFEKKKVWDYDTQSLCEEKMTMSRKQPSVKIVADQCKGCELCVKNCPKQVIEISTNFNRLGYRYAVAKEEGCTGCATCFYTCPEPGTITVTKPKRSLEKNEERTD